MLALLGGDNTIYTEIGLIVMLQHPTCQSGLVAPFRSESEQPLASRLYTTCVLGATEIVFTASRKAKLEVFYCPGNECYYMHILMVFVKQI